MDKTLVIWLNNGATALFHQVSRFHDATDTISFKYVGQSTETTRNAVFNKSNLAGYALKE